MTPFDELVEKGPIAVARLREYFPDANGNAIEIRDRVDAVFEAEREGDHIVALFSDDGKTQSLSVRMSAERDEDGSGEQFGQILAEELFDRLDNKYETVVFEQMASW